MTAQVRNQLDEFLSIYDSRNHPHPVVTHADDKLARAACTLFEFNTQKVIGKKSGLQLKHFVGPYINNYNEVTNIPLDKVLHPGYCKWAGIVPQQDLQKQAGCT